MSVGFLSCFEEADWEQTKGPAAMLLVDHTARPYIPSALEARPVCVRNLPVSRKPVQHFPGTPNP
jgi:hypothetical protein